MNTLTVRLFGGLRAVQGDRVLLESKGRLGRPAEAFAYLLLHRQEAVTNEQLIEALWEDEDLENPAGALKNAIYNLRKQLRDAGLELSLIHIWNIPARLRVGAGAAASHTSRPAL